MSLRAKRSNLIAIDISLLVCLNASMALERPHPNGATFEPSKGVERDVWVMHCEKMLEKPETFSDGIFNYYVDAMIKILGIEESSLGGLVSNSFPFTDLSNGTDGNISFGLDEQNRRNVLINHRPYLHDMTPIMAMSENIRLVDEEAHPSNFAFVEQSLTVFPELKSFATKEFVKFDPTEELTALTKDETHAFLVRALNLYKLYGIANEIRTPQAQ